MWSTIGRNGSMIAKSKIATKSAWDEKKYARLLAKYQPRIPANETDHEKLLKAIESLFHKDMTAEEAAVFDLMSVLADQYAREHYRMGESSTPLSVLRMLMGEHQMKLKDLVEVIGTYAR